MKKITIILLFLPCILFSQEKAGTIDNNGWKQGMHVGSSGSWLFERTYVNDTLTGPFRKYSKNGTTWETGFFKNKEYDSLWTEYYVDGSIETIKNYNEGKKQGEFKDFYKSGKLKYQAVFDSDTLVGNSINYFENGQIKSEGNRKNGIWKTYYENRQVASVERFRDNLLTGEVEKYDMNGGEILPVFISENKTDTSIINKTELKVSVLYETNRKDRALRFGEYLFGGATVCKNNKDLVLKYGSAIIVIKENGVEIHQTNDIVCNNEIPTIKYGINRVVKELPNGEWDIKYVKEKVKHKTHLGVLTVDVQDSKCDDTGTNPISIDYKGQSLTIKNIDNLQFFEYDTNNDGKKELYILTYASCQGFLKIYKVGKE